MTRYVLEALRDAGVGSDAAFRYARVFVERCQNFDPQQPADADGGFFFSTTEFDANKAGPDGRHFRSYGSTTADGILALLALGRPPDDPRVRAAEGWLTSHPGGMQVPGFLGEAYQRWPRGLSFITRPPAARHCARSVRTPPQGSSLASSPCNAGTVPGRIRRTWSRKTIP
jgi:squalene-hopene/tetraprenyl-beta-curcumene cyclase